MTSSNGFMERLGELRRQIHNHEIEEAHRSWTVIMLLLGGSLAIVLGWVLTGMASCTRQHRLLGFAGTNQRLEAGGWSCDNPWPGMLAQSGYAILYGIVGAVLIYLLWPERIHMKPLQTMHGNSQACPLALVPLTAAAVDLAENGISSLALAFADDGESVSGLIALVPLLAWTKWFLVAALALALVAIAGAWVALALAKPRARVLNQLDRILSRPGALLFGNAKSPNRRALLGHAYESTLPTVETLEGDPLHDDRVLGGTLGISCSGGGIRSAAFNLGALSALEEARVRSAPDSCQSESPSASDNPDTARVDSRDCGVHGLLGEASYLASVSGGGFAATAWRTAAGTGRLPARRIIGSPYEDDSPEIRYPNSSIHGQATNLIQYARRHRQYLKNGRGGFMWSLLLVIARMALHAGMVAGAVFTIGWPLGRLAASWLIADVPPEGFFANGDTWDYAIGDRHWTSIRITLGLLGAVFVARLFTRRTVRRRQFDRAAMGLAALALSLTAVLIVVPFVLAEVVPRVADGRAVTLAGAYAGVLGIVWGLARSELGRRAKYLGGVLLAGLLLSFGAVISTHAASPGKFFTLNWWQYGAVVGFLAVSAVLANPDSWSLHGLWRRKLAGTFATRIAYEPDTGDSFVVALDYADEPRLSEYAAASTEGPQPIICAAAARVDATITGVPALSMTFEPDKVTVHGIASETLGNEAPNDAPGGHLARNQIVSSQTSTTEYEARLEAQRVARRSAPLTGLAAVSGAAVAPSMGRMNMKSTNALLAALNVRLGVWLPNPSIAPERDMPPRLLNMFKELLGWYDINEEILYVTDGGHWENLGLVEVIRAKDPRCDWVICIDVSGDKPGSFSTLRQAIKLARLELDVEITLEDSEWAAITPVGGVSERSFAHGTITWGEDLSTAKLLYVKAGIADATPLDIQRFASEDPKFPNYSTGDQFLTDREFTNLARLGYHTMWNALCAETGDAVFGAELAQTIRQSSPAHLKVGRLGSNPYVDVRDPLTQPAATS